MSLDILGHCPKCVPIGMPDPSQTTPTNDTRAVSLATLERAIVAGARMVFNNPKLRLKDVLEWSTGELTPLTAEEVSALVPYVTIKKVNDLRAR